MHKDDIMVLVEKSDHRLAFHNLTRDAEPERIALGKYPHEIAFDPAGGLAFIGEYGVRTAVDAGIGGDRVFVVDIAERRLVNTLDCRPYTRIHGLAVDQQGRLYALSEADGVLLVFDDPRATQSPCRAVVTGGLKSHLVCVARNGSFAFCMNLLTHTVTKVCPHDATVAPVATKVGDVPEGNCLSADDRSLFVSSRGSAVVTRMNTGTLAIEAVAPTRPDPTRIYRAGAGRLLITHFNGRAVSLLDAASLREVAYLPLDGRPAAACLHPRRPTAFVSLDTNLSLEIDLENMQIVACRPTGSEPDACFVAQTLE